MSVITIILFFIYTYGFGFSIAYFTKESENFFERSIMRVGIGLGALSVIGIILNAFSIPIDWKIFLVLSLIIPAYHIIKHKRINAPSFKLTKSNLYIFAALLIFSVTLFMYVKGSFVYDYMEDGDSWHHAQSTKYVAVQKTATSKDFSRFLDPYPPGYPITLGILHQTSESISWTIKFFNALIISLGILFFYFFAKEFIQDKKKALFSMFVFASIPSYLSHFIWAHSLIVTLFIPTMYCLERIKHDKRWIIPSSVMVASIGIIQPSQPVKLAIMIGIYAIVKLIFNGKKLFTHLLLAGTGGILLSLFWWFTRAREMFTTRVAETLSGASKFSATIADAETSHWLIAKLKLAFPYNSGTATRPYTFQDFFIARDQNMINNPIGIGIFISILIGIALLYLIMRYKTLVERKNQWKIITVLWLIFTFLGINTMTFNLPVGLFGFRFWMLFAIPVALISSEGLWFLLNMSRRSKIYKLGILVIIVIGVLMTSAQQKYAVNTATWPPGDWLSYQEVNGYLWLKSLPADTKVFAFSRGRGNYLIGLDKFTCAWCQDEREFQKTAINQSAQDLHAWLKSKQYEYVTIGAHEVVVHGHNATNTMIQELLLSNLFRPVNQDNTVIVLKVI